MAGRLSKPRPGPTGRGGSDCWPWWEFSYSFVWSLPSFAEPAVPDDRGRLALLVDSHSEKYRCYRARKSGYNTGYKSLLQLFRLTLRYGWAPVPLSSLFELLAPNLMDACLGL
jgi:hypothetical protein